MLIHSGGCNVWEPMGSAYAIALQQFLSIGWYEAHLAGIRTGPPYWAKNPATGKLATWYDLSGNGRSLSAAVPSEPALAPVGLNTVARCNADSVVGRNAPGYAGQQKVTTMVVMVPAIATSYASFSWSRFGWCAQHQSSTVLITLSPSLYGTVPLVPANPYILCARFDGTQPTNATRLRIRLNGVDGAPTYSGIIPASLAVDIGTNVSVGSTDYPAGGYKFTGDIMAYCTVFRVLSNAEVVKAETALRQLIGGLP